MSRFFATGSDSESEESSSADEITPKTAGPNFKQSLLLSDDEEDTKRVVRSAKDKRFEELTNLIKTIRNAMKIRDMAKCLEEFEQLCRAFLKSKTIVDKEGVPPFYIRLLADLEDYLNQLWEDKEGKKKMNKNNAKALSTLRQKIRKYNRDYETEIAAYKENPQESADEEEEKEAEESGSSSGSSDDDDDEDGGEPMTAKSFLKKEVAPEANKFLKEAKGSGDESSSSDEDDEDWGSDTVDSGSESSDEGEGKSSSLACRFLKKTQDGDKGLDTKREQRKKKLKKKERLEEEAEEEAGEEAEGVWEKVKGGVLLVKPKMFAKGTEINTTVVVKKLNEILQARGKKGTDRAAQIELLHLLAGIAGEHNLGQGILVKIKFNIIASLYDYNPNLAAFMKADMWKKCLECIDELLDILYGNSNIFIGENIAEDSENLSISETQPFRVRGCILTLVERMDEEFTKIMQNTDPHSQGLMHTHNFSLSISQGP
ncbi:hypothetical protein CRUP_013882 [Coryphaenoides rupestris]|nr:hypothetical protein CRUP_013882 [Coryphaenoides rupestris]